MRAGADGSAASAASVASTPVWIAADGEVERGHEALMLSSMASEHVVVVDRRLRPGLRETVVSRIRSAR